MAPGHKRRQGTLTPTAILSGKTGNACAQETGTTLSRTDVRDGWAPPSSRRTAQGLDLAEMKRTPERGRMKAAHGAPGRPWLEGESSRERRPQQRVPALAGRLQ